MKLLLLLLLAAAALAADAPRFVSPDATAGRSLAVVVPDQPLLHTAQVFDETPAAALAALDRVVGDGARVVKLNAYLRDAADEPALRAAVAKHFAADALPALTCIVSALPVAGARVGLDAVATTTRTGTGVLPAGGAVYVSGQATRGPDLRDSTRKTMESLGATLKALGGDWARTVQLKAFLQPMSEAAVVRDEVGKFFAGTPVPPLVLVEWAGGNGTIEIELIATVGADAGPIDFFTPPGMKTSPVYCRVVRFGAAPRIYIAGLSAPGDAATQVHGVFAQLKTALEASGSDLRHLAKATYYVSADDVSKALNELRPNYYDPARPPSASKAMVKSTGAGPATLTLDMIAVPAR
ncbi:MAG: RidA family protein [Chthoniobacteraceae bacterium]